MALTKAQVREILGNAGVTEDKIKEATAAIISGHTDSIEALREERDSLREDVAKYKEFEQKYKDTAKDLEDAQARLSGEKDYDALKKEFEDYKKSVDAAKSKAAKTEALKSLLAGLGIADKRTAAIIKVSDIDGITLDKDGNIKDADELTEKLKNEWADFIPTQTEAGAKTANPTKNTGGSKMTKEEILAIKDTTARQQAISENLDLFE